MMQSPFNPKTKKGKKISKKNSYKSLINQYSDKRTKFFIGNKRFWMVNLSIPPMFEVEAECFTPSIF